MPYAAYKSYDMDDVRANVPSTGGVYIIRVKLVNGGTRVVYVGQSNNLRSRLMAHLQDSEPNACLKTHVKQHILTYSWVELARQEQRDYEEAVKIKEYNPECNVQRPTA